MLQKKNIYLMLLLAFLLALCVGCSKESNENANDDSHKYSFTIITGEGGTIPAGLDRDIDGEYESGEEISLIARQMPGYVFDKWTTSDGGSFEDEYSITSKFIMPENDVIVTANFNQASVGIDGTP